MRYDILLLDADETLMDFPAAERQALRRTFADHGLTFTQATDDLYQQINQSLWRQFERGEITRPQLLATRFAKLFEELATPGIDTDAFNREYLHNLGYGTQPLPHALELCQALSALGCRLYILTNGLSGPQRRRLAGSGLTPYLSDIFAFIFLDEILRFFGASNETLPYTVQVLAKFLRKCFSAKKWKMAELLFYAQSCGNFLVFY